MVRALERPSFRYVVRAAAISLISMSGTACEEQKENSRLPPPELPERADPGQDQVPGADAAQTPGQQPGQPGQPGQPAPADLDPPSDADIEKFVEVQRRLSTLRELMTKRISGGEDAAKVQGEFQQQGQAVVREVGLSHPKYAQYSQMMQTSPEFQKRVNDELQEGPQANTNQDQERTQ